MGYAEKQRAGHYRGRYWSSTGVLDTVKDANGRAVRFKSKREAAKAANDMEALLRQQVVQESPVPVLPLRQTAAEVLPQTAPEVPKLTFGEYVNQWYSEQDLAPSTMQNYRRHIEEHLLPEFGDKTFDEISRQNVEAWARKERSLYAASSVKTWRGTLHLILADATDEKLIGSNPAARRRGRGRRAGRSRDRAPEKVTTDALGILLIGERASILSGRDDEFVGTVTKGYTGVRWGELVGLEKEYWRPDSVRVEWQLYELDTGELDRCPPKDDSYRTVDNPRFLSSLVNDHIIRTDPKPCECHGRTYIFRGYGAPNGASRRCGVKLADVARRADVSTGTVSNVLNRPGAVKEETRLRVEAAIAELGYVRAGVPADHAAHWRRSGFATWLFQPAVTGWYPKKAPQEAHPVPLLAEPWPGVPARGRNASDRAEACWVPIAKGLTPHGLRHTNKKIMRLLRTPPKLMDERLGHLDGSVQARYDHIDPSMRRELMEGLTEIWEAALEMRRAMCPTSPVRALDVLLRGHR
ncbi:LacI family DNA-binding transcriptional regulator [Streptomyces ehimensis]|uniref:LacI family DNA-binding transcriptional regulator n=1 Tax=Streptomyces ehimensis TaxID=68195 RepID=A0ABV9BMX3_9ACTN